ncbi:MAG: TIGR04282 family arsenosugar biosynthesis glycosyltransferase [Planctomycetota bacterium]
MDGELDRTEPAGRRLTAIFAKRPEPGRVKTRLSPPLTPEEASTLADAMLEDSVRRGDAAGAGSRCRLLFAPEEAGPWFRKRFPGSPELAAQRGPGLAERLASFFEHALAEPDVGTAVAVGSDAPHVPAARLAAAHRTLEAGADVVLGLDAGGGYYLIGMRRAHPELFLDVPMSTGEMGRQTVALARSLGLRTELLEEDYDVDVEADLRRLARDLAGADPGAEDFPRATARVLATLSIDAGA